MDWKSIILFLFAPAVAMVARMLVRGRVSEVWEQGIAFFVMLLAFYPLDRYLARAHGRGIFQHNRDSPVVALIFAGALGASTVMLIYFLFARMER